MCRDISNSRFLLKFDQPLVGDILLIPPHLENRMFETNFDGRFFGRSSPSDELSWL